MSFSHFSADNPCIAVGQMSAFPGVRLNAKQVKINIRR
ncbi:hypothetical protein BH20CHL3_BH20CHL3_05100 [soil metagenome]